MNIYQDVYKCIIVQAISKVGLAHRLRVAPSNANLASFERPSSQVTVREREVQDMWQ